MKFTNILKIALNALRRNKTRAVLTMLGIIIGIASVIAMVSLGRSSTQGISEQISAMGSNMIMVMPETQRRGGVNLGASASQSLTPDDMEALRRSPNIAAVSPNVTASGQLVRGANNWLGSVTGSSPEIFSIRNYTFQSGIPFNDYDVRTVAKVCVIGQTIVENLFPDGESPIGQTIRFGQIPLTVIGVLESKGQSGMGQDQDDVVFVPYTTVQKRILAITHVNMIMMSAVSEGAVYDAMADVTRILRTTHKIQEDAADDFRVHSQQEILDMMGSVMGMLTILLTAIAAISLVVGGIGIMNIMYVTVTERTKEIGLRMSIGAPNSSILMQFLAESTVLCLIGGVIGIILGLVLAFFVSFFLDWPFVVSTAAVALSFLVCAATGIFFGWYPAKKAANLDPINALRYE